MCNRLFRFTKILYTTLTLLCCFPLAHAQQVMPPFVEVMASADTLLEPDQILYSILLNPNALYGYNQEDYYAENLQQERETQMQLKRQQAQNQLQEYFKQAGISDKQLVIDSYSLDDPNTAMYRPYNIRFTNKQQLEKLIKLLQGNEMYTGRIANIQSSKQEAMYEVLTAVALKKARDKAVKMARTFNQHIGPVLEMMELSAEMYYTPVIYNPQYPTHDAAQSYVDPSQNQYMVPVKATVKVKFALQ
ncbi:MAG: SIMPL domain-containing protein [Saprospiraceae bacterium]|nr:SIMPL domain-containing protein [Saprospiraceae bacterium]